MVIGSESGRSPRKMLAEFYELDPLSPAARADRLAPRLMQVMVRSQPGN
jgi:hypothetical protein